MKTKERFATAATISVLRSQGTSWKQVRDTTGIAESTGRKLLKDLAEHPSAEQLIAQADTELAATTDAAAAKADKPAPRSGRYLKGVCACVPAKVIRVSKSVLAAGVTCKTCDSDFADAEAS